MLVALLLLCLAACSAGAQTPATPPPSQEPAPVFKTEVKVINVSFSVRNQKGALAGNLTKNDFMLYEDRVAQQIKFFSSDQETPLTVGILIDRSGSQNSFEDQNLYVALAFLKRVLRPQDRAFVVGFEDWIREVCPVTGDLDQIEQVLRNFSKSIGNAPRIGPAASRSGGTALLDTIYWSTREKLESLGGRKALIMIGDGRENSSKMQLADTIEALQKADVIFYGLDNGGRNDSHPDRMPLIAAESGGHEYKIGALSLQQAFDEIEQELRTMYSIGYVSTNTAQDGRFRRIDVRPAGNEYVVRARPGYYAR